jgi:hypothetical protein
MCYHINIYNYNNPRTHKPNNINQFTHLQIAPLFEAKSP